MKTLFLNGDSMKAIYLSLMLSVAGQAAAAGVYIDESQKQADKARAELISKGIKVCGQKKFKTVGEADACKDKYFEEAKAKYPRRGTEAYALKNYAGLSRAAAEQKLIELKSIYDKTTVLKAKHPGQVSRRDAEVEGWWIQTNVLGASATQTTPWFIECSKQEWQATVDHCPLGSGGKP